MVTAPTKVALFRVLFLVAGVVVIVSQPGGYDLVVALVVAVGLASVVAVVLARSYLHRDRPFRLGRIGSTVMLSAVWLAVLSVSFYFLYYPESIWRWSQ